MVPVPVSVADYWLAPNDSDKFPPMPEVKTYFFHKVTILGRPILLASTRPPIEFQDSPPAGSLMSDIADVLFSNLAKEAEIK